MTIITRHFDSIESAFDGAADVMGELVGKFGPELGPDCPDSDWGCGAYHGDNGEETGYWVEFPGESINAVTRINFVLSETATRERELERKPESTQPQLATGFTTDVGEWYTAALPDCPPLDIPDIGQLSARRPHDGMSTMYRFRTLPRDYALAGDGMPMCAAGMKCLGFSSDDLRHCREVGPLGWQRTSGGCVSMFLYGGGGNYSWEIAYCPSSGLAVRGT